MFVHILMYVHILMILMCVHIVPAKLYFIFLKHFFLFLICFAQRDGIYSISLVWLHLAFRFLAKNAHSSFLLEDFCDFLLFYSNGEFCH